MFCLDFTSKLTVKFLYQNHSKRLANETNNKNHMPYTILESETINIICTSNKIYYYVHKTMTNF